MLDWFLIFKSVIVYVLLIFEGSIYQLNLKVQLTNEIWRFNLPIKFEWFFKSDQNINRFSDARAFVLPKQKGLSSKK